MVRIGINKMKNYNHKFILKTNGYYFSKIKTSSIINDKQNSIKLIYDVELGEKAKIKEIIANIIKNLIEKFRNFNIKFI